MSSISKYLILNKKKYFALADEYIGLQQLFKTDTFYEKLSLFMELVGSFLMSLLFRSSSMNLSVSFYKTFMKWKEYIRYLNLKEQISEWKQIIKSVGGPYISTNDETYLPYVYADGMQRLHDRLFGLSKESAKCIQ
jgi:hypothetical protein